MEEVKGGGRGREGRRRTVRNGMGERKKEKKKRKEEYECLLIIPFRLCGTLVCNVRWQIGNAQEVCFSRAGAEERELAELAVLFLA